jgi:hypothetical protein
LAARVYDKGEKRHKHDGRSREPKIEFDASNPRKWVGKCPRGVRPALRSHLLDEAIPGSTGDREIDYPKRVYVVHAGAIYEAQTSDHGQSYHGYPYRGELGKAMIKNLREMAVYKGCLDEFERWVKEHIVLGGRR